MKLGVCGGRVGSVKRQAWQVLDAVYAQYFIVAESMEIGHGGAPGYDRASGSWAAARRMPCTVIPVNGLLDGYKDDAPKQRNRRILDWLLDTNDKRALLAFPGGPGSRDMVQIAHDAGVLILDVEIEDDRFTVWQWKPKHGGAELLSNVLCEGTFT